MLQSRKAPLVGVPHLSTVGERIREGTPACLGAVSACRILNGYEILLSSFAHYVVIVIKLCSTLGNVFAVGKDVKATAKLVLVVDKCIWAVVREQGAA